VKIVALGILAALLLQASAMAADVKHVHVRGKQVNVVGTTGKVMTVREKYPVRDARVAPNGMAAAWLLVDEEADAATLVVYRKGKRRTVQCGQVIRDYWFAQQGEQIAYDCGGRHFAGNEVLFDTRTLKEIARFHQADIPFEKRPAWSTER
jgi:hypothetical protein